MEGCGWARRGGAPRGRRGIAVALLTVAAAAASCDQQTLEPSPYVQQLAGLNEPLPLQELIDASLVLSGASDEALATGRERLAKLIADVRTVAQGESDPAVRGELVLVFMHERVLSGYVETQSRVDVLLRDGRYNCVSSAVLYMILARAVDLPVVGVRTHDHAFCGVWIGDRLVDVETTNEYGFDPGEKKQFADQFGKVTGFTYVPANRDPSRVETDERGLLSLILQNAASLATQARQYEAAVAPAVDAYALARDDEARRKLLITVSNLAAWLATTNRFADALAFLDRAAEVYGAQPRLASLREDLVHNEIVGLLQKGEIDQATRLADARRSDGELGEGRWRELMVSAVQLRARRVARERGYLEALRLVREGIDRLGNDARLLESERVYRHNFEVEAHNAMVGAYNSGRYQEARTILEKALESLPDSARLRADLAQVSRAMDKP